MKWQSYLILSYFYSNQIQKIMSQQTKKFLDNSHNNPIRMIQSSRSQSQPRQNKQITRHAPHNLQNIHRDSSRDRNNLVAKKIQKRPDNRCFYILTVSIVMVLIVFCIDVYHEKKLQLSTGQIIRRQCYQDYQENECLNPVDVLKDKCRQLQLCYSLNYRQNMGILQTAAKIIGKIINSLLSHTTIVGGIVVVVLIAVVLFFALNSNGSEQIKVIYRNKGL